MSNSIALAAGGTGGHMFPAEALAQEVKRRGSKVLLLTDERGMRYAEHFPADEIVTLKAANPNVRGVGAKLAMAWAMAQGVVHARSAIKAFSPGIVVGFGGYPSAPGLFAARLMGLPYAVHEQNAVLGRVNRRAAPGARFVAHGFERLDRLPAINGDQIHLGNPVRDEVRAAAATPYVPPALDEPLRLLIFGGSQGAALFARVFPQALARLPADLKKRLSVTHQVSEQLQDEVSAIYADAGIQHEIAPFFSDLPKRMAEAHFVIARSGASTVSELATIGRPSLLVPLGIAMDDHQRANAEVLVDAGGATMVQESALTEESAAATLLPWLSDPQALAATAANARGRVPSGAASALADKIESLLG
ncbi:MAG: undecaprenyldiphospho-muramoylpentapeptide beta-N-acetylglucosaminyltransferase [Parvularcula sp.]